MQNKIEMSQKLEQRLNLTQDMRMSLEILKLNGAELLEYVLEESQTNPALDSDQIVSQVEKLNENYDLPALAKYLHTPGTAQGSYDGEDNQGREYNFSAEASLEDHLLEQLGYLKLTRDERRAGEYIIYSLDGWGYFRQSIGEAAVNLDLPAGVLEKALGHIRAMEPAGIGAENLSDCLILQLTREGCRDTVLFDLVKEDLEAIGSGQTAYLMAKHSITAEQFNGYLQRIRRLNPKPSAGFTTGGEKTVYVVPDAQVGFAENGELQVVLNQAIIPEIHISRKFIALLESSAEKDREALQKYVARGVNLAKFIAKRNATLKNVITAIAGNERDYLEGRSDYLKPLTLARIAEETGLSISTISRTARSKYIDTPRGLIHLKLFFQRGIQQKNGQPFAKAHFQAKIKGIIKNEAAGKPLSDEKITAVLNQADLRIKRRTVAKYREEMNIPTASVRKQRMAGSDKGDNRGNNPRE